MQLFDKSNDFFLQTPEMQSDPREMVDRGKSGKNKRKIDF